MGKYIEADSNNQLFSSQISNMVLSAGMSTLGNTSGTTGLVSQQLIIAGGNNVTLSQSVNAGSATLTISAGGGAAPTLDFFDNQLGRGDAGQSSLDVPTYQAFLFVGPLVAKDGGLFPGNLTANTVLLHFVGEHTASNASTAAKTYSFSIGIYTEANSTQLSLLNSVSTSIGTGAANNSQSASFNGPRWLTIHSSQWSAQPVFSQTRYYLALWQRTSGQSFVLSYLGQRYGDSRQRSGSLGVSSATNTTMANVPLMGLFSATFSTTMPAAIANSDLDRNDAVAQFIPNIVLNNRFAGTW